MQCRLAAISLIKSAAVMCAALASHSASASASAECSYAEASRHGGWGWDPIAEISCAPIDQCDYSNADVYGGWGWNPGTETSCPPLVPVVGECIDSDGDGWGWDGVDSCVIDDITPTTDQLLFVDIPGRATGYDYLLSSNEALSVFHYYGDDLFAGDSGNADVFLRDNNSGSIKLLSVGEGGVKANNDSYLEGMSVDGETVLIQSLATNIANSSANGVGQPYLVDTATGTVAQVLDSSPWSYVNSVLSDDGNFVAFSTAAGNIVSSDRNGSSDVFLFDVASRVTTRVTLTASGEELNGSAVIRDISGDGRYVLFIYEANDQSTAGQWATGLYLYDRLTQTNKVLSYLDGDYHPASISADGVIVAHQYWQGNSRSVRWVNTQTGASGTIDPAVAGCCRLFKQAQRITGWSIRRIQQH